MTPTAWARTRGIDIAQGVEHDLERILAPQLLQGSQRTHADKRMGVRHQGKDRVGTGRILELGHAVGRGGRHGGLRIDQQLRECRGGFGPVELAERQRHLLTNPGIRIGHHAVEQRDRSRGRPSSRAR